jgi:hypothetical protein
MEYTRAAGLNVHECSLKKHSLEDSFFNLVGGKPAATGNAAGRESPAANFKFSQSERPS